MKATTTTPARSSSCVVAAVWFGTSNAAREIVSERAIYMRERMVNLEAVQLRLLASSCCSSFFCVVQCTVLLGIVFFSLGFHGGVIAFGIELATLIVTAMNSVALGLVAVAPWSTSSEAAMALTPIALIPQIVLGGLMVPMTTNPLLEWPMYVVPARWGFQGVVAQERHRHRRRRGVDHRSGQAGPDEPDNFVLQGKFKCAEAQIASMDYNGAWGFKDYELTWLPPAVLAGMMVAFLIWVLITLKRRDSI